MTGFEQTSSSIHWSDPVYKNVNLSAVVDLSFFFLYGQQLRVSLWNSFTRMLISKEFQSVFSIFGILFPKKKNEENLAACYGFFFSRFFFFFFLIQRLSLDQNPSFFLLFGWITISRPISLHTFEKVCSPFHFDTSTWLGGGHLYKNIIFAACLGNYFSSQLYLLTVFRHRFSTRCI